MMRFRFESEVHGAELVRVVRGLLASMLAEMAVKEPPELFITDGSRQQLAEVDTDPITLRPNHAVFDTKSHFVFKNGKNTTYMERRDDTSTGTGLRAPAQPSMRASMIVNAGLCRS